MTSRAFSMLVLFVTLLGGVAACGDMPGRAEATVVTLASGGHYGQPTWSADGNSIVVLHSGEDGYPQVEVLSGSGKHVRTVETSVQVLSPGWLDGKVVFLDRGANGAAAKLKVSTNGGNETLLVVPQTFYVSWSRTGGLAVLVREMQGSHGLWTWNADSQDLKQFWSDLTQRVKVSPGGKLVAFTDEKSSAVFVHDLKNGITRELWQVPSPGQALSGLAWSPDEEYLGVTRTGAGEANGFYVMSVTADAEPHKFLEEILVDPDWHPDGNRLVFSTVGRPGKNEVKLVTLPTDWRELLGD